MNPARLFVILPIAFIAAVCPASYASEEQVVFADDFNRADADSVGNDWTSKGSAVLKDKAALFQVKEEEFRPRIKHTFPVQKTGKLTVSFKMDWRRTSEGTWAFYMQLGNSAEIPRLLIQPRDLSKGIGVNLLWGGGEWVNNGKAGSFGYMKDGVFKALFVVNDEEVKATVVDKPVVTIHIDLDAGRYSVQFDGKTYADLPFDNKGPIDTIRFITDGCSATGFSKSSIDDVLIRKSK